jgi:hypothetical protein
MGKVLFLEKGGRIGGFGIDRQGCAEVPRQDGFRLLTLVGGAGPERATLSETPSSHTACRNAKDKPPRLNGGVA